MKKILHALLASSLLFSIYGLTGTADASDEPVIEALTRAADGKGLPNGSSADEIHLSWLVPTQDKDYGYTKERPVQIGGLLEGTGHRWSGQYFASLLGPNGEPTRYERIGSCCRFPLADEKLAAQGFTAGFLDVYEVAVGDSPPVRVYVSLYAEEEIHAPAGFTTRGGEL